ncbi:MAG TPA: ABC transporter permease [Chloroflexota bacterium]
MNKSLSGLPAKASGAMPRGPATPGRRSRRQAVAARVWPPVAVLVILLLIWQGAIAVFNLQPYILPGPWDTVQGGWAVRSDLGTAVRVTFVDSLLGLAFSIAFGLLIAILIARFKTLERGLLPYAVVLQTIPIIGIAPLIILWIGTGDVAIVVIALIIGIFPIISSASLGLISTDHNLLNMATMYNATGWQQMVKLRLPNAVPYILAGVRISSGLAVIGAIVGEFFAGTGGPEGGLGDLIQIANRNLETAELFAAILLSSIMGIVIFAAVNGISYFWLRNWHESSARREN